ncbi:MAG: Putative nucleic acid-binding protein, contains PIN domain [uncultured Sulfurovum sp.]|uniref:Nucleic acid-binding protein, contains PIN domain n=1 Tax=uncultured Sulfurovum sp. TaxID=269237 RepID=A0A6S6SP73_9BACT|nr:MAG: Putative nucleic acid-binding protein, contains PIN domain [uncultured Sulfurovum sp.]
MKVLLDTNIVLDVLLARKEFIQSAREIFVLIENDAVDGYLCASSVTTLHYLLAKNLGKNDADKTIEELLSLFNIANIDKTVLQHACSENGLDYEDSVIYCAAKQENIDIIVTRDKKGFKKSKVTVVAPEEFLALMKQDNYE